MNTRIDENAEGGTLLAEGRPSPELKEDHFPQPAARDGDPEGHRLDDRETLAVAAEGDDHGDEDASAPEVTTLDGADEADAANRTDEGTAATDAGGQPGLDTAPGDDTPGDNSGEGDAAADVQVVPRLTKQALESLLDESTGKLVALEDFECKVDDRARENEWLGKHTPISLAVFQEELDRTGKYTFNVDENGVLLDDPVKFPLAREAGAQITLRVHHGLNEAKKSNFILLAQGRDRERTEAENRELKRRIILAALLQGLTYEATAELAGVHPNTARNVEKRAAADSNSRRGITKRDRRVKWSTPENISEAHRLRAEGKNNSQIAKALGTTPATIGTLFKDRGPQANVKIEEEPKPSPETAPDQSPPPPPQVADTLAPDDGIPNVVRLHLERHGLRGREADKAYAKLLKPQQDDAREKIEALAKLKDELLKSFIYHREAAAFAEAALEKQLLAAGKEDAA